MIKKRDNPDLGTVSHGTLLNNDLISAFSDKLKELNKINEDEDSRKRHNAIIQDCIDILHKYSEDELNNPKDEYFAEDLSTLINEDLFDALNDFAPPYCYFGANEGDGSDFGFWPMEIQEDRDNDLVIVKDSLPSNIAVVSDHGNITMYSIDDGQIFEEWSIV